MASQVVNRVHSPEGARNIKKAVANHMRKLAKENCMKCRFIIDGIRINAGKKTCGNEKAVKHEAIVNSRYCCPKFEVKL